MQSFSYHSRLSNSCICCIDLKLKGKLFINLSEWNLCCDNVARKRNTWRYKIAWSTCMFSFNCVTVSKGRLFYLWNFNCHIIIPISLLFIFFTIYKPVKFHQISVWLINCRPTLVTVILIILVINILILNQDYYRNIYICTYKSLLSNKYRYRGETTFG